MPKVVDHDERREEIVRAAGRVIAREGLEGATVRKIADEAGYSSGVLDHYFAGKDDILVKALQASHARIRRRVGRELRGRSGLAALRGLLLDNLPLTPERLAETRLEMNFWARSLAHPALTQVQEAETRELRLSVLRHVVEAQRDGHLRAEVPADDVTERLLAFVDGMSVHATLYPSRFPAQRQAALLDAELSTLMT